MKISIRLAVLALASLWLTGGASRAALMVTLDVAQTPLAGGLTRYDYTMTDLAASDESVAGWAVGVATDADLSAITGPPGWEVFYIPGDTSVAWFSTDSSTDLRPGASAVFSITSPLAAGPQDYLILGDISDVVDGRIAGPSVAPTVTAVPEPSTGIMAGTVAAGGLLWLVRLRRRRGWPDPA